MNEGNPRQAENDSAGDPIFSALRDLRREEPRPDFTRRVLLRVAQVTDGERAGSQGRETPGFPLWRWAIGAAMVVLTVSTAALWERQRERQELRGRFESLRREHTSLQQELEALRNNRSQQIYLGGDDGYDYVLDLSAAAAGAGANSTARALPDTGGVNLVSQTGGNT